MFLLFLVPVVGRGHGEGQCWALSLGRPTLPIWHVLAGEGKSHLLVGREKLLDQSPQLTQPQAPAMVVMEQEQELATPTQLWGFPGDL